MRTHVSVLICTAGRPQLLEQVLESLAAGTRWPDQLVIVNGGDDTANEVVARHAARFPQVVLLQYENKNLSISRNLGLEECTGDIIAMTDDDAVVCPAWLESIVEAHDRDERAGAVGGPVRGARDDRFLSRLADRVVFPSFSSQRTVRTLPGVNVAYKRHVVQEVGAFDETLFRGEDVDFNWRLIRLGYHLTYHPNIEVVHTHRDTFMGLVQQQWMYGRAYVLVRRKWQDMYSVYPRRLRSPRDWAKALYCEVAVLFHPALAARRMDGVRDGLLAYPLLVVHHAAWKLGMLRQALAIAPGSTRNPGTVTPTLPPIRLRRSWPDPLDSISQPHETRPFAPTVSVEPLNDREDALSSSSTADTG